MFSGSTILTVYLAPRDAYTFKNFKKWHYITKKKWQSCLISGADEVRVLENNKRNHIFYKRKLNVLGWRQDTKVYQNKRQYQKTESAYSDILGDVHYDYIRYNAMNKIDWWGLNGKYNRTIAEAKKKVNIRSVPETHMLNTSSHLNSNSAMEKMYLGEMSYEDAVSTTFKGKRTITADLMSELVETYMSDGLDEFEARKEAMKISEIVQRNRSLKNNSPGKNTYGFLLNYHNRFIDPQKREMLKFNINFWFLKELISHYPNLGLYVMGLNNNFHRIQGLVGKRDQNVILKMRSRSKNKQFEFVYSVSRDTLVNETSKGYIPATNLKMKTSSIINLLNGSISVDVEHRYRTEQFFGLILDGKSDSNYYSWIDAHHYCWIEPDYFSGGNLEGLEIIC